MTEYITELRSKIGTEPLIVCGANVIILDVKNRILLHHRRDNDSWGLPGGIINIGEKLEDTAIREVEEEVGLVCKDLKLFNVYSGKKLYYKYPNGDEVYNVTTTYICRNYSGKIKVDKSEGKEAMFFYVEHIPNKISKPVKIIIDDFTDKYQEYKTTK